MTSKRDQHAELLEQAESLIRPLDERSVRPDQCIRPALEMATSVYAEMQYAQNQDKRALRVGVLRLRGILAALDEDRAVSRGDYALVRECADSFAAVANHIRPKSPVAVMQSSSLGLRFSSLQEMADAGPFVMIQQGREQSAEGAVDEVLVREQMRAAEDARSKLPRRVPSSTGFVLFRCPIIVYLKHYVGDVALDRAGLKWSRMDGGPGPTGAGMTRKVSESAMHGLLLSNQILVGFDREALKQDRDRIVDRAVTALQARMGSLVSPMDEGKFLVSPGNPLDWLWLVPSRVMSTTRMSPASVSFAWRTDVVRVSERDRRELERELKQLNEQHAVLLKQGKSLNIRDLTRQSELMETLHRADEVPVKSANMQQLKQEMNERIKTRTAALLEQIADMREDVKNFGGDSTNANTVKRLKQQIKTLTDRVEKIRDEEMKRARRAMAETST